MTVKIKNQNGSSQIVEKPDFTETQTYSLSNDYFNNPMIFEKAGNIVDVHLSEIGTTKDTITQNGVLLGTIPVGFRPKNSRKIGLISGSGRICKISINKGGSVYALAESAEIASGVSLLGTMSYIADTFGGGDS